MMRVFMHWLTHNASSAHHRWMMRFLQRRGWVVFYLPEDCRRCENFGGCVLDVYKRGCK